MATEDASTPANGRHPERCMRCGTCCRKDGPTLHRMDRRLVEQGLIPARHLFTIRIGEPVHDNLAGRTAFCKTEMIKVRGGKRDWTCVFFDPDACGCRIYDHRPAQCAAQKCWAPEGLEDLAAEARLSRSDLLAGLEGLWDLIVEHERRCPYREVREAAESLCRRPDDEAQARRVLDMVRYDAALRQVLLENGRSAPEMLDFLLGRPLTIVLPGFGFTVDAAGDRARLSFSAQSYRRLGTWERAPLDPLDVDPSVG